MMKMQSRALKLHEARCDFTSLLLCRFAGVIVRPNLYDGFSLSVIDVQLVRLFTAAVLVRTVAERKLLTETAATDKQRLFKRRLDLDRAGEGMSHQSRHGTCLVSRKPGYWLAEASVSVSVPVSVSVSVSDSVSV